MPKSEDPPARSQHASDHLANERTFLAWVRTAVAIIGLGFVVSRFALYLRTLAAGGAQVPPTSSRSAVLGVALVGVGAATVLLALARYLINRRAIANDAYRPSRWIDIFIAVLITIAAVVMMVFLLTSSRQSEVLVRPPEAAHSRHHQATPVTVRSIAAASAGASLPAQTTY